MLAEFASFNGMIIRIGGCIIRHDGYRSRVFFRPQEDQDSSANRWGYSTVRTTVCCPRRGLLALGASGCQQLLLIGAVVLQLVRIDFGANPRRSEEHTSELQSRLD